MLFPRVIKALMVAVSMDLCLEMTRLVQGARRTGPVNVLFDLLDHVPTKFEGMPPAPTGAAGEATGAAGEATGTTGVVAAGSTTAGVVSTATPCALTTVAPSVRSAAPIDASMLKGRC